MYHNYIFANGLMGLIPLVISSILFMTTFILTVRKRLQVALCTLTTAWLFGGLAIIVSLVNLRNVIAHATDVSVCYLFLQSFLAYIELISIASIFSLLMILAMGEKTPVRLITMTVAILTSIVLLCIRYNLENVFTDTLMMQ